MLLFFVRRLLDLRQRLFDLFRFVLLFPQRVLFVVKLCDDRLRVLWDLNRCSLFDVRLFLRFNFLLVEFVLVHRLLFRFLSFDRRLFCERVRLRLNFVRYLFLRGQRRRLFREVFRFDLNRLRVFWTPRFLLRNCFRVVLDRLNSLRLRFRSWRKLRRCSLELLRFFRSLLDLAFNRFDARLDVRYSYERLRCLGRPHAFLLSLLFGLSVVGFRFVERLWPCL